MLDIVMTTRNRLEYLDRTLDALQGRTQTPHLLHVIDDASTDGTVERLLQLQREGVICDLVLRGRRAGSMANKNLSNWLSFSDPFVITADDILCPDVEPDWLRRGVDTILADSSLGQLDLNHPGAYRRRYGRHNGVTYATHIGGTFGFIRRSVVPRIALPHYRENFGEGEDVMRSDLLGSAGYKVGYLTETFCYHFGRKSSLTKHEYAGAFIEPTDWKTLRPPEEWVLA